MTGPASVPERPAISVGALVKRYAGRAVVDGVSFEVPHGAIMGLLGPNGAGKTTTVEILEGYRRPDAGEVRILGLDPRRDGGALRARIGLMLQGGGVQPGARPREILRLYAAFYAAPRSPAELLALVGLEAVAETRFRALSGGERQRLGLALALVGRPELLLLDEPTAGMDPAAKAATRELIGALRTAGATVLLTTHELADVERLADRVVIIDHGRVVAAGTVPELIAGARPRLRVQLAARLDAEDVAALGRVLGGTLVEDPAPGRYRLDGVAPGPDAIGALATWCAARGVLITELRAAGASLEERYLELTGETGRDEAIA